MDWVNRGLGLAIAIVLAGGVFVVVFALFGAALLGAAATILAIPLAFPLTTSLAITVIGGGVAWTYVRRRKGARD